VKYSFTHARRVRAVRVRVTQQAVDADRDITKGDGEIGFRGARHGFDFHLFDASGTKISEGSSQACFDHHARLPDIPGLYCLTLTPADEKENPSVEVDYGARMHGLGMVQMPGDEVSANIAAVCDR